MSNAENWEVAFETRKDIEATVVADRLKAAGIPAVVMNRKERFIKNAFSEQQLIQVLVQPERLDEAKDLLSQQPLSDKELEQAALNADLDTKEEGD